MTVIMAVFVGLRIKYNDTLTYINGYINITNSFSDFNEFNWSLGANPGFELMNRIFRWFEISSQTFVMIYAVFTICIYMWFIRKYTSNIFVSAFLFFTMGIYTFTMAAIKQTFAVALCLVAVHCALQKKWFSFVVLILIASTFHPYALMYLIVPFLMFKPWTQKTYLLLGTCIVLGIVLQSLFENIVSITTLLGEEYTTDSFSGEGVNVFRVLVVWIPVVLSFWTKNFLVKNENSADDLFLNLSMLNAGIMFVALFGTANYFARLANYFLIFQTISLPYIFKFFTEKNKKVLLICSLSGYLLYFYYANAIAQTFDAGFIKSSVFEYIKSLFF